MTSAIRSQSDIFSSYHPAPRARGPLLVATDTSAQSDAAFPLANAIAEQLGLDVHVISAVRPVEMPMYAFDGLPVPLAADAAVASARVGIVAAQMTRVLSPDTNWPITVRSGDPARDIVEFAQSIDARLILVGRGRHTAAQRAFGGETVLRLLQLGDSPVMAIEPRLTTPPANVVIATDFSEFSLHAAKVAMELLAPTAVVHLVHVSPAFDEGDTVLQDRALAYRNQVHHAFSQLHDQLARNGVTFHDVLVEGSAADEVIKIVRNTDADLVVSATHGYGFLRRMILGSVSAELIRQAPCSVLCVPGSAQTLAAARARSAIDVLTRPLDVSSLDGELKAFTDRNLGRRCSVEIDHRDLGAQMLGHGLPLVGATYDRGSRVVSLMFGAAALSGQHLTHAISSVTSVDVTTDGDGRDQVLRLVHPDGQTLVMLE